jgi:cytochrome d ubiquinol oxidase subunit II
MINAIFTTNWLSLAAGATLAFAVLMYVLLDGTDLGVGVLLLFEHDAQRRESMINTILPVWDGNETWIVLGGGGLIAMFPIVYGALLSAMYPVFFAMLFALIFRGVAIEFRGEAGTNAKARWDWIMVTGSVAAAFCQGVLIGSLVQGIRTEGGSYRGGPWDWVSPFTLFCGIALAGGYAWLATSWLMWRTEGKLQRRAWRWSMGLGASTALSTAAVSIWTLLLHPMYESRWLDEFGTTPLFAAVVGYSVLAACFLLAVARQRAFLPLVISLGWFTFSLCCVLFTIFPLVLPPSVTIEAGSSPPHTQAFVLSGASVLLPVILIYSTFAFCVFRGKVTSASEDD